ncbi:hypothetical protein [Methyloceanibacter sp.]|uniref:hypothetical protein n=1 Tax=Methyloceanibacter sp. TaxID=1965321 RepID=UPI002CE68AAA|nr:hypothetical protein [Methyloceanibacter sp.]HML93401.1 hypothetical protein [Methyloceanibacter sp.]
MSDTLMLRQGVIEPVPIDDTFCPVIAGIQPVGPCHRVLLGTLDAGLYGGDETVSLVAKPVMTDESLAALARAITQYLAMRRNGGLKVVEKHLVPAE